MQFLYFLPGKGVRPSGITPATNEYRSEHLLLSRRQLFFMSAILLSSSKILYLRSIHHGHYFLFFPPPSRHGYETSRLCFYVVRFFPLQNSELPSYSSSLSFNLLVFRCRFRHLDGHVIIGHQNSEARTSEPSIDAGYYPMRRGFGTCAVSSFTSL